MRRLLPMLVLLAVAAPAGAHVPRSETQRYRTSVHLGPWLPSEQNCRTLRGITVACFDLEGMETAARIAIDDATTDEPISGLAEFRVAGVWSGYSRARRFCGDGTDVIPIPAGATAMLVRTAIPAMDHTWCLNGVGVPVSGTITAAFG